MIRINLLQQAKKTTRAAAAPPPPSGSSVAWAVTYLVVGVLWCAGLGALYVVHQGKLDEQQRANRELQQRIDELKKKSERLDEVKAQLERSKELEALVEQLDEARTGPTRVLHELSQLLSESGGPTIDPDELRRIREDNPLAGFNRSWDVRRLWLQHFEEQDRACRMRGQGKTNEDVAEFLRRLSLSELFDQVTLTKTHMVEDKETDLTFIGFELTCKVRY